MGEAIVRDLIKVSYLEIARESPQKAKTQMGHLHFLKLRASKGSDLHVPLNETVGKGQRSLSKLESPEI